MLKKIIAILSTTVVTLTAPLAFAGGQLAEGSYPTVITEVPASALDLVARALGVTILAVAGVIIGVRYAKSGRWPSATVLIGVPGSALAGAALAMLLSYGAHATLTLGAVNLTAGTVLGVIAYAVLLGGFAIFGRSEGRR